MKKHILKYSIMAVALVGLFSCTKNNEFMYADPDIIDVSTIDSVVLVPNHTMLVADGKATIDLAPVAYTKEKDKIYGPRVKDEWFDFTCDQPGVKVGHSFSTDDQSLVGKTIKVKIKLKGRESVASEEISFKVIAPIKIEKVYTIPIVFHIIQTTEDIESYGGPFDRTRIDQIIDRLNLIFSGNASTHPTGVNTKIQFKAAIYSPEGLPLAEKGINRLVVKKIPYDDEATASGFNNFLSANKLIWSSKNYMNVWLISHRATNGPFFGWTYGYESIPKFRYAASTDVPEGLTLTDQYDNDLLSTPKSSGVTYKLQSLNVQKRVVGAATAPEDNDLMHYVGSYLGLLRTGWFAESDDYCDDTQKYVYSGSSNITLYKTAPGIYFMGENIMDDPTGVHRSITQQQYLRMQWVLENSPEREAWRSDFAFTGRSK